MENLDNNLETKPAPQPSDDLQAQIDSLRQTVLSLLVLCVIVSGTLCIFLVRQHKMVANDLKVVRPQASQIISQYTKVTGPAMQEFVKKLSDYGKTHPDFAPILLKYGLTNAPTTAAPTSVAPTAAPVKK